eukprot:TRINITY_DN525_c0_g1_i11.p1 TRINITY_DN525_c0_g1~~TRINITY_DN525_c0_g1_i11.p1  ORF type:complete len:600 (+),score=133.87 TRINITY_DN525_c0_g1_i11:79-1878(+)
MAKAGGNKSIAYLAALSFFMFSSAVSASPSVRGAGDSRISAEKIQSRLNEALASVMRGGEDAGAKHLETIEAHIWQTYQALPKNDLGRLPPKGVRYLVHNYFAREHGWVIKGLEPLGHQNANVSAVHDLSVLQDKAPALVESLLEARRADHGLSLSDMVAMVAALERLILDESLTILEAAYRLNLFTPEEPLSEHDLHSVLQSYLLLFKQGQKADLVDGARHRQWKNLVANRGGQRWKLIVDFESDAVNNYAFANNHKSNPFEESSYSFKDASSIIESMAHSYGKWQNQECHDMKEELMSMDPDGSGRVPLPRFYTPSATDVYKFTEGVEYLKQVGAYDASAAGGPRVRIANYMLGPSNCIASSTYYSICCISECESLLNQLEAKVQAPTASPSRLVYLVREMSSSTVDSHRELPDVLVDKLQSIADHHGGDVPLHGRLFSQWMHHAFPNECPFPQIAEDVAALDPRTWKESKAAASQEERAKIAAQAVDDVLSQNESDVASLADNVAAGLLWSDDDQEVGKASVPELQWTEEEVLHAHDGSSLKLGTQKGGLFGSLMRWAFQGALLFSLLRVLFNWQDSLCGGSSKKKAKCEDYELPF